MKFASVAFHSKVSKVPASVYSFTMALKVHDPVRGSRITVPFEGWLMSCQPARVMLPSATLDVLSRLKTWPCVSSSSVADP